MTGRERLAAVVEKPRAQAAIGSLRAEGVYDDDRSVYECGEGAVAIPVTDHPVETAVREVVRQEGNNRQYEPKGLIVRPRRSGYGSTADHRDRLRPADDRVVDRLRRRHAHLEVRDILAGHLAVVGEAVDTLETQEMLRTVGQFEVDSPRRLLL